MPPAADALPVLDPSDYGPAKPGTRFELDLAMAFQPVVDINARTIVAYEALARGPNGKGEATMLARVTPENVADFDRKCRALAIETASALAADVPISVNILPSGIDDAEAFVNMTLWMMDEHDFPREKLMLEYCEPIKSVPMTNLKAICRLTRRAGIGTIMDNFGMGTGDLNWLATLRPRYLKLDPRLIHRISNDARRRSIIAGLQAICLDLDVGLIAKSVETEPDAAALYDCGITLFQGIAFAEPQQDLLPALASITWPTVTETA